ncbi:G-box-binding factor [Drosophila grimshawi]|uniref:G-box-binding factor n=1 Tax=Drosophila grimshawi TaxID=7222 RepID=UPI0013EF2E59|nr:G-box-binding factor [Drosophila grimshawi]
MRPSPDNLQSPPGWRPPLPPPMLAGGMQQIRREFNGNWPHNTAINNAATRFAHSKDAPVLDVGKSQFYRPKDGSQYNYNVNQYTTPNFKASPPHFNGNIAVKNNEQNKFPIYTPIKQYAIPVEANKYLSYADPTSKQTQTQPQTQTQTLQHHNQLGKASNGYAVYEDTENAAKNAVHLSFNYQQNPGPQLMSKDAEKYLHFMGTNDYFLPRRDPNYKQLDAERDQISYHQQQQLIQRGQQQQQHQQPTVQTLLQRQHTDSSGSSSYNKPLRVSDLFYQQDPAPANSAVVRGSYQAGQNAFVVKSDGNKSVKHILSTTLTSKTTQTPPGLPTYTKPWQNAHKTATPEPVRFEFTEHDAIKGSASYTNAPQAPKFYYETHTSTPQIPSLSTASIPNIPHSVKEGQIVGESKDGTAYVKKRPQEKGILNPPIVATDSAESPKDNEAYCEKICANVYDENDEIVCGSDGYMYTGETQLQCYSTCLNIEVSIQSKGSCA